MVLEPRLIVADEPVSSLDASVRGEILALMLGLVQEKGVDDPRRHARPRPRLEHRRPGRGHVPRADRRAGADGGAARRTAAPVHAGAAVGRARARADGAADPDRRGARPDAGSRRAAASIRAARSCSRARPSGSASSSAAARRTCRADAGAGRCGRLSARRGLSRGRLSRRSSEAARTPGHAAGAGSTRSKRRSCRPMPRRRASSATTSTTDVVGAGVGAERRGAPRATTSASGQADAVQPLLPRAQARAGSSVETPTLAVVVLLDLRAELPAVGRPRTTITARVSRARRSCSTATRSAAAASSLVPACVRPPPSSAAATGAGDRRGPSSDRKLELDRAAVDEQRAAGRRRPDVRPVGAGEREPDTVARLEDPRRRLELELHRGRHAGLERLPASSCPSRWARLRIPRVTSAEVPSGKTSQSFAERYATGAAAVTRQAQARVPHHVELALRAAPSRRRARARRRVAGRAAGPTAACRRTRSRPSVPTSPRTWISSVPPPSGRSTSRRAGAPAARSAPRATRRASRRGRGRVASSGARRPRSAAPRRSRCARRGASGRTSGRAPARGRCAGREATSRCDMWLHGPISRRFGQRSASNVRKRVVAVAVGPAGDDHRRARDPVVVGTQRAVAPVRPVDLLLEPAEEPGLDPRCAAATPRASRRRTRPAPAAARCRRPCTSTQSTRSIAFSAPPM